MWYVCLFGPSSWASFDISNSLQVKAFSRSLESFKTAIVVGGTNIYEQVSNFGQIILLCTLQILRFIEGIETFLVLYYTLIAVEIPGCGQEE